MREGLIPHQVTTVLRLPTNEAGARMITEVLSEVLDPESTAVAAFEQSPGDWLLEVYFANAPDEQALVDLVEMAAGRDAARAARFAALEAKDWVAASLEGLRPVRAGRFLVHGAHGRALVAPNDLAVEIEASLAFGTGHHGTTRGCLLALDALLKEARPRRILDIGAGTGVLAIAAAKALRREIVAGDIDPIAVEVARGNALANGVGPRLRLYCAPGLRHTLARSRFDLIFANILARPLVSLAPALAQALAPRGRLILSGLLDGDVAGVLAAFRAQGLYLRQRRLVEGWATLVLG